MWSAARRVVGAIAVMTVVGCGGDDGPAGSISLAASPTSQTLDPGSTGTITVTLTRGGGFTEPVNVTVEGLPNGVTATVLPAQLTGQTTSATVTLTLASTAPAGTYPVTVRGSASGIGSATATWSLTITALPDYTLSATPSPLSVAPGSSGQATVNIARTNYAGSVNLALDAPPAGITATFNPAAATGTSSVATINVANTVANGSYTLTIKGTATGVPGGVVAGLIDEAAAAGDRTTTLQLTVAPVPSFTIAAAPNAVQAAPGGNATSTITIARTNLTADIGLSLVSPPAGITGVFAPATLSGTVLTSQLTLSVASTVAAGAYTVTVQGTGGSVTKTTTVGVTVATAGSLTWEFCNNSDLPLKFWRQSGGTWTEVLATTTGAVTRYTFNIASATGGIAFTISNTGAAVRGAPRISRPRDIRTFTKQARDGMGSVRIGSSQDVGLTSPYFDTFVLLGQASELGGYAETCATTQNTINKMFNVTGQPTGEEGLIGYGGASAQTTSQTTAYNLAVVPGTYDWLAMFGPLPSIPDLAHNWNAYRVGRGEAAPGAAVAVNRSGAAAFVQFPFTFSGGAGGSLYSFSETISGARGTLAAFALGPNIGQSGVGTALFLAPGDRVGTDMVALTATNTEQSGNNIDFLTTVAYLGSAPPASSQFTLAPKVPAFTTSQVQGAPVTTWQAAGAIPAAYQTAASVVEASFTGTSAVYAIAATRAWLTANGMSTNYTLAGQTLPGFLFNWAPTAPLSEARVIMLGTNVTVQPVAGTTANIALRLQSPP